MVQGEQLWFRVLLWPPRLARGRRGFCMTASISLLLPHQLSQGLTALSTAWSPLGAPSRLARGGAGTRISSGMWCAGHCSVSDIPCPSGSRSLQDRICLTRHLRAAPLSARAVHQVLNEVINEIATCPLKRATHCRQGCRAGSARSPPYIQRHRIFPECRNCLLGKGF